jgi:hypothetical protein
MQRPPTRKTKPPIGLNARQEISQTATKLRYKESSVNAGHPLAILSNFAKDDQWLLSQ